MVPSLSQQLLLQHRRQRLRGTPSPWRVSSELPVSLQTMADAAETAALAAQAAARASAAPQPIQRPAPVLVPSPPAPVSEAALPPVVLELPCPAISQPQTRPRAEAVALVVWLLLVLIDGGLSLALLLRRQEGAQGRRPRSLRRWTSGCSAEAPPQQGCLPPLVRAMAADQPAVAIS